MYSYNDKALKNKVRDKEFSKRKLCEKTNSSMPTVMQWVEGGDLYVSKLLKICNAFRIPLSEFIVETPDGPDKKTSGLLPVQDYSAGAGRAMAYEEQIRQLKLEHREKLHEQERMYLNRIAEAKETATDRMFGRLCDAVEQERKRLVNEFKEEKLALMEQQERIRSDFDRLLNEKNDEIVRLKAELLALKSPAATPRYKRNDILSETDASHSIL